MMPFDLPPENPLELPPEIRARIDESVARFEQALGFMAPAARATGQIDQYWTEVTEVARFAYTSGFHDGSAMLERGIRFR